MLERVGFRGLEFHHQKMFRPFVLDFGFGVTPVLINVRSRAPRIDRETFSIKSKPSRILGHPHKTSFDAGSVSILHVCWVRGCSMYVLAKSLWSMFQCRLGGDVHVRFSCITFIHWCLSVVVKSQRKSTMRGMDFATSWRRINPKIGAVVLLHKVNLWSGVFEMQGCAEGLWFFLIRLHPNPILPHHQPRCLKVFGFLISGT